MVAALSEPSATTRVKACPLKECREMAGLVEGVTIDLEIEIRDLKDTDTVAMAVWRAAGERAVGISQFLAKMHGKGLTIDLVLWLEVDI